jgi:hypothetical protein
MFVVIVDYNGTDLWSDITPRNVELPGVALLDGYLPLALLAWVLILSSIFALDGWLLNLACHCRVVFLTSFCCWKKKLKHFEEEDLICTGST